MVTMSRGACLNQSRITTAIKFLVWRRRIQQISRDNALNQKVICRNSSNIKFHISPSEAFP